MKFEVIGDRTKPAVVLIHGMLCTYKDCLPYGKYLADEYCVIMPTLNGHGNDGTELRDVQGEAAEIIEFLQQNNISQIALLQGSSMGAEVALEVRNQAGKAGIGVKVCFFDGGPFFDFAPWFRGIMKRAFKNLVKSLDTDDREEAERNFKKSPFFKFVGKGKIDQYQGLVKSMVSERRTFSDTTIGNMVNICYACKLPEFGKSEQESFVFFFSVEEPARKSKKRLIKVYPNARYVDIDGYAHCG